MTDVIMNSSAEGTVSQMRISGSTNFVPLNRSVSYEAFVGLIFGYVCLGLTGVVGNSLVCSVVFRNKQMRTARNMLIVNLAASDLILCYETIGFCYEQWPVDQGATIYSIATMVFQYLFPTIALIFSYSRICRRLQDRMGNKGIRNVSSEEQRRKRKKEEWRVRRTNYLLVAIAFVFAVTWLPLNILNIVSDLVTFKSPEKFMTTFGCCHMLGMTSACSNPIIYGWFNENFQKEFRKIFSFCTSISAKNDANRGVNVRSPKEDVQCENKSLVKL
ncbi:NPY1R (predicted) [Pycnogonum litorale]